MIAADEQNGVVRHRFLVEVWLELSEIPGTRSTLRGRVRDLATGVVYPVAHPDQITAVIDCVLRWPEV